MSVGSALQKAAIRLVGRRPGAFFPSSQQLEIELCDLVNEVAEDVVAYTDWQGLTKIHTLTGNGATEEFALPSDYGRMLLESDVQDPNNWVWGYGWYADINTFMRDRSSMAIANPGAWIIYGDEMHFTPAPAGQAQFPYISKNYAVGSSAVPKASFTDDADEFVLPERLLTLGLIWRWRENKGLPQAAADQQAFIKALDEYAAKDRGSRVIRKGFGGLPGSYSRPWPDALWGR